MPRPASDKRDRLVAAASEIVAARGLDGATIATIAASAGVPQGSVYYYFSTKAAIAAAAVEPLAAQRQRDILDWSTGADPRSRLTAYLDASVAAAETTLARGTAATLASQLRAQAPEAARAAAAVIAATVDWAAAQYRELGFGVEAATARALHLVTGIEGAAQLSHAMADATPLEREGAHLARWVASSRSNP